MSSAEGRRERRAARASALLALALLIPSEVRAFDVELDTDTSFQIYEVRSPSARAFLARRRLLSRLALRLTHDFEEPDDEGRVLRLTVDAQLRLEQDFGETCLLDRELCVRATDPTDPGAYQPLAADTRLDVPSVWAQMDGLPLGGTARLGRQLVIDRIGFSRFDGLTLRAVPVRQLHVEVYGGLLARSLSIASTDRSEPAGSIRLPNAAEVPFAAPEVDTWVVGGSVGGGAGRYLQADLGYRHMFETDGQVMSRLSLSLSSTPLSWLRLDAGGVYDVLTDEIIQSDARVALGDGDVRVRASLDRRVPRFDPGTIWAWFVLAPITVLDLGASWQPSEDFTLGGSLKGRHAELPAANVDDDLDGGVDAYFTARVEGFTFGASGFAWSGALGPLAGVSLDLRRGLFGWLELELDVSVWHFDDPNRPENFGTVISESLAGRVRLSPETLLFIELTHAASERVGNRFRGMLAVRVDTWR